MMGDFLCYVFMQVWPAYIGVIAGAEALLFLHRNAGTRPLLVVAGVLAALVAVILIVADSESALRNSASIRYSATVFLTVLLPAAAAVWAIRASAWLLAIQVQVMVIGAVAAAMFVLPFWGMLITSCLGLPLDVP